MKKILVLFVFVFASVISAQEKNITVVLKNESSKEPISGASVSVKNSNKGAVSNDEGTFRLSLTSSSEIEISHLTYKPLVVSSKELKEGENVIFMKENDVTMEEIIISKIPVYELLSGLIENSANKLSMPIHLNTYCREFIKNHGKHTRFTDGLVDLHIKGKPKKIDVDAIALQNRSYGLNEEDEASEMLIGFDLDRIIEKTYEFGILKNYSSKKSEKKYNFEIKSNPSNENIQIIHITPKSDVEEMLYHVKVAYDINKKVILSVESKIAESHLKYSNEVNLLIARALIKKSDFKANFKFENDKYFLANTLTNIHFKLWNKRNIDYDMEAKNAMVITNYNNEDFSYNKSEVMKKGSLVKKETNIKTKYWEFDSGLTPTSEEEDIITSLASKT